MNKFTTWAAMAMLLVTSTGRAEVSLPAVFSDHAVLQQGAALPVWGWANPGEEVEVRVGDQSASTSANKAGEWRVDLKPVSAKGPLTMTVKGTNTLTVRDILVGEVWLCSGQSNMAMQVSRCKDFEKEKASAKYPQIRMFKTASSPATEPQRKRGGQWIVCSPETVGGFSGTAYFFARKLHREMGVPVGLLNSSVGGTAIEAWTSMDVQKGKAELKPIFAPWDKLAAGYDAQKAQATYEKRLAAWKPLAAKARKEGKRPPRRPQPPVEPRKDRNHPSNLFNGMIAPLVPYAIRGAIWYQGERNARTMEVAELYRMQLPLMIQDWRSRWNQGDFPVYWVQLPNFKAKTNDANVESSWASMRESMRSALSTPNTGMAITIDVGEAKDIHPKNKQDVGARLARLALSNVYDKAIVASGPLLRDATSKKGQVVLTFDHAKGLKTCDGQKPQGFAVAGADGQWHWAEARIDGETVVVTHPQIKEPQAVRYAWADNPEASLCNTEGLPASPFTRSLSNAKQK